MAYRTCPGKPNFTRRRGGMKLRLENVEPKVLIHPFPAGEWQFIGYGVMRNRSYKSHLIEKRIPGYYAFMALGVSGSGDMRLVFPGSSRADSP